MPLLDHFHPPLVNRMQWHSFSSQWASTLVQHLNTDQLPPNYIAGPNIKLGVFVESDIGALHVDQREQAQGNGVATAVYAPPQPMLVVQVDFAELDLFEIQLFVDDGGAKLVAAIELVSPSNKDRPSTREAFVRKCASYLQEAVAVVVVDVVTSRSGNLHADLLTVLGKEVAASDKALYAVAYRTIMHKKRTRLEVWPADLELGRKLPTLPLWLAPDLAVPLDLEQSYLATCTSLRIPQLK